MWHDSVIWPASCAESMLHCQPGLFDNAQDEHAVRLRTILSETQAPIVVISDATVSDLYQARLSCWLAPLPCLWLRLQISEQQKDLSSVETLITALQAKQVTRQSTLIAFGGGVIGDVAGFVAATYRRGLPLWQIPTTLLAQVDAALGGKTAVNVGGIKNVIGSFYPAQQVLLDPHFLTTLPEREFRAGLVEVLKHALIADPAFFEWLERHWPALLAGTPVLVTEMVQRASRIKWQLVARDPYDLAERQFLNLGHTVGHALEALDVGAGLKHGEAVAYGLLVALRYSEQALALEPPLRTRVMTLLSMLQLPALALDDDQMIALWQAMRVDKKNQQADSIALIGLRRLAEPVFIAEANAQPLREALELLG